MRPAFLLLLPLLLASGVASAQQKAAPTPAPAAKPAVPAKAVPAKPGAPQPGTAVTVPVGDDDELPAGMPTKAQLAELACANEFNFVAEKLTETRWVLKLAVDTPACRSTQRVVKWKISGDDGLNFAELAPSEFVKSVKPVAAGVEVEVIENVRFYAYGAVPVMEGVNAESPVLMFGASDDTLQLSTVSVPMPPVAQPKKK